MDRERARASGPTAAELVSELAARITEVDGATRAVCALDPEASRHARERDAETAGGIRRSRLHGMPILLKDIIDVAGRPTTAGSRALLASRPRTDATIVQRLVGAGMIVLGKANLTEWSNIRDGAGLPGWSAVGGLTRNPYALNRSASGSSSGCAAAVAARLTPFAIGSETDGSITNPAAVTGVVGLKPTVGLLPTDGIVPISWSQDAPGPMALTVADVADLLSVLVADGTDYRLGATAGSLAGKRIGVPRGRYWGYSAAADAAAERAVGLLGGAGATIVDGTDLPSMDDFDPADELHVMLAELEPGLRRYLSGVDGDVPRSLAEIVEYNKAHPDEEMPYFGQSLFDRALEIAASASVEDYRRARAACVAHGRTDGIDRVLAEHGLDALITPTTTPATPLDVVNGPWRKGMCSQPAALAGYPLLTVPSGTAHGLPVAVTFWGGARSERTLLEIGHGYEQARDADSGPLPAPTLPSFV
jgi:amidase